MKEVRWIKLAADIFDNRKIRQIEALPDGDAIIVIWLKLLCLAGTINDGGLVYFTREIPYTEEMMATQFCRPLQTVKLALQVFEQFGMIETTADLLHVCNWEKYQSADGLEKIREQARERMKRMRERKKTLSLEGNVTRYVTVTESDALEIESESEKEEKEKNKKESAVSSKPAARVKPVKHQHGEYSNVLLTEEEFAKLSSEFPNDYEERIEQLSRYMKSTGKSYKDHLATIRNWARRDGAQKATGRQAEQINQGRNYDYDAEASKSFYRLMEKTGKAKAENAGANAAIYAALEAKKREQEGANAEK